MSNAETLAKAGKELMLKEPFYGLLLMALNKVWDKNFKFDGHGTAGVSLKGINYQLTIEPEFWEKLIPLQKMGILKHELLHIAFFHLTDYSGYKDKELLNVAMDIEINQYIDRSWLPNTGCFLEKFPELNMEEKKGTRYYYKKLEEAKKQNEPNVQSLLVAMGNKDGDCKMPNGNEIQLPNHSDWGDVVEKLDAATKKLIENQTKHIVTQVADQVEKSRGTIPGEMKDLVERLKHIEPPKFDWKGYIRRFTGKSTKTYTKKSRRKMNKRLPDNPGLRIMQQKHILAAIDTSGSVSKPELKEFLNELHHLKKTGSDVTIVQCDTAISHIGRFNPKQDLKIHGRGGTDFQPVIDYYNEHQRSYSCLMYFTDGEAPAPQNARGHILWVISSVSNMNEGLPGHVIKLEL